MYDGTRKSDKTGDRRNKTPKKKKKLYDISDLIETVQHIMPNYSNTL